MPRAALARLTEEKVIVMGSLRSVNSVIRYGYDPKRTWGAEMTVIPEGVTSLKE
ncbi:hypothetical protein YWA314_16455 [Yersinia enterocolitica subsp. enterocolitica WA-314]|nr:hypothetical protein YWA314_16455 [Yersinia enterocolitica subsp. enterocolitica WA-314]